MMAATVESKKEVKKSVQFSNNVVSDIRFFEPLPKQEKRELCYRRADYERFRVERHLELLDKYEKLLKKQRKREKREKIAQMERSEMGWSRQENFGEEVEEGTTSELGMDMMGIKVFGEAIFV
jgi:hypothetical protein